jgi:ribosomal-protein-alanine N-acetyltransferase
MGQREHAEGVATRWLLQERDDLSRIIGSINLTQIVRGSFHAAHLGYSIDGEREGRGLMTEGLWAALDCAFGPMRLHRIMAAYIPDNVGSARVLEKLGFVREGYAKGYLFIAGKWEDHILTARIHSSFEFPEG